MARFVSDTGRALGDVRTWTGLTAAQMRRIGVQSLPIALFIAVFTGVVLALLASYTLTGAVPLYFVGTMVGKAVMIELAPVLTGLALSGRVGANIAAELGMGTARFAKAFQATIGIPPYRYLILHRVRLAVRMLVDTSISIAEVALRAGFASQSHMTTQVGKATGRTPATIRQERERR